ncbi:MAG: ATP synthase F1 subunit delta [Bacteroidetes bacterium]|jgi:F-type H+-transporting ATPase subunit delta|nr:ATP synthase F1 subunit delta [Bacteroidota bacterium]MCA6442872.1 ATP synthase F1 subunit delta [Bacteroidota bacterium]
MSVASRYAKSLIDLAIETKQLEEVRKDMQLIKSVCQSNGDFVNLLESPIVKTDKKMAIFKTIFEGKISATTQSFLNVIAVKKREGYIDDMANAFDDLYKQQLNITTVKVESAVKLDDASKQQLLNLVKTKVTGQIELVEKVNPELIGGFIITINDTQIDQSVRTKLNQLRKNFSTNLYLPELN